MSIPSNFNAADTFLGRKCARPIKGKRRTQVVRLDPDTIALRYHGTSVVTWHRDGSATLRTNGWKSVTTKARINDAAPCRVYQDNFKWYVVQSSRTAPIPFEEGMRVYPLPPVA